jgi:hypothetical protein
LANADDDGDATNDGTTGKGQCVFDVRAGEDAALGEHEIEVVFGTKALTTSVKITVVGATDSISSDAPAFVEPGSQTEITATGADENGDAVGPNVGAEALLFEGDGALIQPDVGKTNNDGEYVFSFVAPTKAGTSSILVEIGDERETITLTIGTEPVVEPDPVEPDPVEPDPEMMEHGFSTTLVSGVNITSYTGSLGELAMDAAEAGVSVIAVSVDGEYVTYIVGAPAWTHVPFNDLYPDGLDGVIVVAVVN